MKEALLLMVFGGAGTLGRWGIGCWTRRIWGEGSPHGTLVVNVTGCLVLGFVMTVFLDETPLPRSLQTAVTVGFLGAFTTFSTFGYETLAFAREGAWLHAAGNATANFVLGLVAVGAGIWAARFIAST
jgi:fluoride exporter